MLLFGRRLLFLPLTDLQGNVLAMVVNNELPPVSVNQITGIATSHQQTAI